MAPINSLARAELLDQDHLAVALFEISWSLIYLFLWCEGSDWPQIRRLLCLAFASGREASRASRLESRDGGKSGGRSSS